MVMDIRSFIDKDLSTFTIHYLDNHLNGNGYVNHSKRKASVIQKILTCWWQEFSFRCEISNDAYFLSPYFQDGRGVDQFSELWNLRRIDIADNHLRFQVAQVWIQTLETIVKFMVSQWLCYEKIIRLKSIITYTSYTSTQKVHHIEYEWYLEQNIILCIKASRTLTEAFWFIGNHGLWKSFPIGNYAAPTHRVAPCFVFQRFETSGRRLSGQWFE